MRRIRATAPARICDAGGWTDTWFAVHGVVCHLAIEGGATVDVTVRARVAGAAPVVLDVAGFGDRYPLDPAAPPGRHPLLEATLAAVPMAAELALDVRVASALPPGSATGTSAAVVVALLAALDRAAGRERTAADLAVAAHRVETERLGLQSGVQDQHAAALGGANLVEVDPYPSARVERLALAAATRTALGERLVLLSLGHPHSSSALHEQVIARLAGADDAQAQLEPLRRAAREAAAALAAGDLAAYGAALTANTEAQAALHPDLVSATAREIGALALDHGAAGWKVNGAGGDGGSVALVGPDDPAARERLVAALDALGGEIARLPLRLAARGVTVTEG